MDYAHLEEKDEMAHTLRERLSGPFGMPATGSDS